MIHSVEKALDILERLSANENREMTLSEIASALSMDISTCANLIKTLRLRGYIDQSAPRSGYRIGYKLYHLSGRTIENDALTKISRVDIESLGSELNECALLSVIRNDRRIVLMSTIPDRSIIVKTNFDKSVYRACTGRMILSCYTQEHLEQFINRVGFPSAEEWPGVGDADNPEGELVNALVEMKRKGYAMDRDSNGIAGFAAPIFKGGHICGSVGVYLPLERLKDSSGILDKVLRCAGSINEKLEKSA
ncbi:MAG: helix-turn-helix domain-containing protein [Bacteroidales bacterium]|nr:helix-turn-helix domain-containing protein [Bacteroidales bacterium]